MEKEKFLKPEMEVIRFDRLAVVCASGNVKTTNVTSEGIPASTMLEDDQEF